MQYKYLLDYIYQNFKTDRQLLKDSNISFSTESNTNIHHFCIHKNDVENDITGTIIKQNHQIIIYFSLRDNNDYYLFISKANIIDIHKYKKAIINNCCLKNQIIESYEKIIKNYDNIDNLYKFSTTDKIIENGIIDDDMKSLLSNIIRNNQKKY